MRFEPRSPDEGGPRRRPTLATFRNAVVVLVAVTVASPVVGAAATMGLGPNPLGAGRTAIPRCDTDGFTITYTTVAGNVTAASVGGIADPGCEGGELQITLTGRGATTTSSSVTVPTDGDTTDNSLAVTFASPTDGELVNQLHVAIAGP
jgi:hypothetical protein